MATEVRADGFRPAPIITPIVSLGKATFSYGSLVGPLKEANFMLNLVDLRGIEPRLNACKAPVLPLSLETHMARTNFRSKGRDRKIDSPCYSLKGTATAYYN